MPYKDPEIRKAKNKEYGIKHYAANKETIKSRSSESNKRIRKRNRDFVIELKESNPCTDCGQYYPYYVMHFDHIYEKTAPISDMSRSALSIERLQREIDGCELVCANCHAIRTHERKYGEDTSEWV